MKSKKTILYAALIVLLVVMILIARHPSSTGTSTEIQVDGFSVIPGETTVQEIMDNGFDLTDLDAWVYDIDAESKYSYVYDAESMAEGQTEYTGILMVKDNESLAYLNVANRKSSDRRLGDCVVSQIALYSIEEEERERYAVNGIPLRDLTYEKILEEKGDYTRQSEKEDADGRAITETFWSKDVYELSVESLEDGTITKMISKIKL